MTLSCIVMLQRGEHEGVKKDLQKLHYSLPARCMVHPPALMMLVPFVQSKCRHEWCNNMHTKWL